MPSSEPHHIRQAAKAIAAAGKALREGDTDAAGSALEDAARALAQLAAATHKRP